MLAKDFVLYNLIILMSCNVLGFVISLLPIYFKRLLKYRIQNKKIDSKVFYGRLPLILFNIFLVAFISSIGLYFIFQFLTQI